MASTTTVISDAVARFYLEHFGKGPLQARTHMHGDTAVTVLRDILTPAEKVMIEAGKIDSVVLSRVEWQRATDEGFRVTVGKATGRKVMTAISGFELEQEMATEVFIFEPEPE